MISPGMPRSLIASTNSTPVRFGILWSIMITSYGLGIGLEIGESGVAARNAEDFIVRFGKNELQRQVHRYLVIDGQNPARSIHGHFP